MTSWTAVEKPDIMSGVKIWEGFTLWYPFNFCANARDILFLLLFLSLLVLILLSAASILSTPKSSISFIIDLAESNLVAFATSIPSAICWEDDLASKRLTSDKSTPNNPCDCALR